MEARGLLRLGGADVGERVTPDQKAPTVTLKPDMSGVV